MIRFAAGAALFFLTVLPTAGFSTEPAAQPIIKNKSCPSGYRTSGDYCIPGKNGRFAIAKIGSCPSGYRTSGHYCLAGKNASLAIPKSGSCPSGYRTSGKYCIAR